MVLNKLHSKSLRKDLRDLHFEVDGSVVFRVNTSIKRRTISLHPPLEGQQIKILVFFVGPDDETVGD